MSTAPAALAGSGWRFASSGAQSQRRDVPEHSLMGDLRTMLLGDLLLWLAARKKSGTLRCRRSATRKEVVFRDGALVACASNDPRETLGQVLLREQLLGEEQLLRALERQQQQPGVLLGTLLVAEGRLGPEALQRALRAKAEETIYELFLWSEGGFYFEDEARPHGLPDDMALELSALVQEGNRRRARWRRIRESLPHGDVAFAALCDTPAPVSPAERRMLELARSGRTLAEISLETRRSEFSVAEYLHALVELKVLSVVAQAARTDASDAVAAIERRLALADEALRELRLDAAFEAYQDVLALDALNLAARQGLVAVSDARKLQRQTRQAEKR